MYKNNTEMYTFTHFHHCFNCNWQMYNNSFYRASYASALLGVVILSVCPSVCHTRAL